MSCSERTATKDVYKQDLRLSQAHLDEIRKAQRDEATRYRVHLTLVSCGPVV